MNAGRRHEGYLGPVATSGAVAEEPEEVYCPYFHHTVEIVGRRWMGVILLALQRGLNRFGDIREAIPGLSDRLLSQRLRELETEGLLIRTENHGQVRYSLSEAGDALSPVIEAIEDWTANWADRSGKP